MLESPKKETKVKVSIKELAVSMEIKNTGITLDVYDTQDRFLGDLVVTKTKVIWCPGKTSPENGRQVDWTAFIKMMGEVPVKSKKSPKAKPAAKKAAKKAL